jgi:hypothetical protein
MPITKDLLDQLLQEYEKPSVIKSRLHPYHRMEL